MNIKLDNKFYIIIFINILIYLVMNILGEGNFIAIARFGLERSTVVQHAQYYRLFTYAFLHADIIHITTNMIALYFLSVPVKNFTSEKFALLTYFVSILFSAIFVVIFSNGITIGASGAIYGLLGILIYYAIKQKKYGYDEMFNNLMPLIIINLLISFMPGISLIGHAGGVVAGILMAYLYDSRKLRI